MSATAQAMREEEFLQQLPQERAGYHFHHPFEVMLREGKLNREQVQGWVANRYYYKKASRSRTAQSSPTVQTARCAASGLSAFWSRMVRRAARAAMRPGSGSAKPVA